MWARPVPIVVRGQFGVSPGGAQHTNMIEAWFAHAPGLLVATPSTAWDAKGLIKTALRGEDPVIFLMHKVLTGTRGEVRLSRHELDDAIRPSLNGAISALDEVLARNGIRDLVAVVSTGGGANLPTVTTALSVETPPWPSLAVSVTVYMPSSA